MAKAISTFIILSLLVFVTASAQPQGSLPVWNPQWAQRQPGDWLVQPVSDSAGLYRSSDNRSLILYNGLLMRSFVIEPNLACSGFINLSNGQQLLRAVEPEARLILDNDTVDIGGLLNQPGRAYLLPDWLSEMPADPHAFRYVSYSVQRLQPLLEWHSRFLQHETGTASGIQVKFLFRSAESRYSGLDVFVCYRLYSGMPLLIKSLEIENHSAGPLKLNRVTNEILALVEEESAVVGKPEEMKVQHGIYVETNYAFNNAMRYDISDQTTHWKTDSAYTSQVNYNFQTPCLLEIYPDKAPGIVLQNGDHFRSVITCELLMDSYDRERRGLAIRRMYRSISPWVLANPIFMHLVSKNDDEVRNAINQCVATGYEAVILSFGSHLNMEDSSAANIRRWKALADYAHQRHIALGGYSLFSSRQISDSDDVIDPASGKPGGAFFGHAPCFGSRWGLAYRDKIKYFFAATGFDIWENDGPYPGDVCASTTHPGHTGLDDSQWRQMNIQKELYHWLNERGIYINAPDWYFLDGTNKIAIGYREVNFSLPRDRQKILNRQNIYDGTWEKTPSMGWGFVPLTRYQGGGSEAILEPLHEHLDDYRQLMFQYYSAGVQACYRGPRLFDTDSVKEAVKAMIGWYRKYRDILNADIIHLRRADGRDWDGWMHISPHATIKGMIVLFNPLPFEISRQIKVPLYYTGLSESARIRRENGKFMSYRLDRDRRVSLDVTLKAGSYSWWVIE